MAIENLFRKALEAKKGRGDAGDDEPSADPVAAPAVAPGPPAWANAALALNYIEAVRTRRRGFVLRLALFIGLPTLAAALYVFLYATPRYVSEFQVTYQSFDQSPSSMGQSNVFAAMFGLSSSTVDMSRVIASYLASTDALAKVDAAVDLRNHYSSHRIDWLDRLAPHASPEQFLDYYQKRISVDAVMGGYVIVDLEAFDPETAYKAAQALAAASDEMVQALSERALQDAVHVAAGELARTQDRLLKATVAVTTFRNQHNNFDPQAAATQLGTVVGTLESQLSGYRAALESTRGVLSEQAPAVMALHAQIRATEQQIAAEESRLATTQKPHPSSNPMASQPYSQTVADYVGLIVEQQFATDEYTSAKQALDLARANAAGKKGYVNSFVRPNLPQKSTSPDPFHVIAGTFLVAALVYMLGSLLVGAFRDQAGA
jgi:capsular polysaccharide transport system permease protein